MARSGIPYFPLDVQLDSKFELIEAEFGLTGFGVVVKLFQMIYGQDGYYIEWTNEVALLFAKRIGLGGSVVSEIVEAAVRRGIFDKNNYDKYRVLTSKGIQERYFEAVSRRKIVEVKSKYLLVKVAQICKNADIKWENVDISSKNVDISEQSKEEKSIEEKSILCPEQKAPDQQAKITLPLNDKSEYPIFEDSIRRWIELYPGVDILSELRKMKGWLTANPKRRKTKSGIERFINGWLSREQDKARPRAKCEIKILDKGELPF